jgi:cell division septal protein FtsQ
MTPPPKTLPPNTEAHSAAQTAHASFLQRSAWRRMAWALLLAGAVWLMLLASLSAQA